MSVERVDAQSLVIQADSKVPVLHQLMERQHSVIWLGKPNLVLGSRTLQYTHLHNSFRHLGTMKSAIGDQPIALYAPWGKGGSRKWRAFGPGTPERGVRPNRTRVQGRIRNNLSDLRQ